jgi:tetratricopeptide (TPR) repeat protein
VLASRSRVPARVRILLAALLLAAATVAPGRVAAQITAPRLTDETEEPDAASEEDARELPPPPRGTTAAPAVPVRPSAAVAPPPAAPAVPPTGAPAASAPAPADGAPAAEALPPPPPPPTAAQDQARAIVPVRARYADVLAAWGERRTALREGDPARADAAQKALLAAKRDLAIDDLVPFAAAEVREVGRALAANLPADAVSRAETAVELAPSLPDAHLALARARLEASPSSPGPALSAVGDAISAALREPHTLRAFYGDLLGAAFAAVFTCAVALILLLLLRRIRYLLHDFHHLPLLRGTAPIQTGFLAVVLLVTPVAFGLGPLVTMGVLALAAWIYLSLRERIVVTVALAALVAMPWAAEAAARLTAWTGSLAETVHDVESGALPDAEAAALVARVDAEGPGAPAPLVAALGRHAKRRGDLELALRLYRTAAQLDPRAPELDVDVGNVLFLKGDLEGAKAAYLAAIDRAGADRTVLGVAHYDLSKAFLRTSQMDASVRNREKAESEAGAYLRDHGSDDDFGANRYLVDVPVPAERVAALAATDGTPGAVRAWVRSRLLGTLPAWTWPWGGVALLAALWLLGALEGRLRPSHPCARCGGASCHRCDAGAGAWCGQCVNVFEKKGVVEARDRLRKVAQVRRHTQFTRAATRVLALVGGGAGQVFHGAVTRGAVSLLVVLFLGYVVWFWRGILPPPQPSPYVLAGKLAIAVPLGLTVWLASVRDAFRRTRGS